MESIDKKKPKKDTRTGECISRTMIGNHGLNEEARRIREERLARECEQSGASRAAAAREGLKAKASRTHSTMYGHLQR